MIALVTGGQGFVGSHLCERLLAAGHTVRVLARPSSDLANLAGLSVAVVRGDVCVPETLPPALDGVDAVFHLAGALRGFHRDDFFRVNGDGTRLLAAAAAHVAGLQRFVHVSSLAAAGPSPGGTTPLDESAPPRPLTWYGASKLAGEEAVRATPGLPSVVVRPPIVYGPCEKDLLGFFRLVKRGIRPVLGGGARHYSLVYAPDLAEGLVRAAEADVPTGSVYYLAGNEVVSWEEFGRRIAAAVGVRGVRVPVPEWAAAVAGRAADVLARLRGRPEVFGSQKVVEMRQRAFVCTPARAARDLGWTAATPLPDGLARTAAWYRAHGWL